MKELNIRELTVEQKIGQLLCVRGYLDEEDRNFVYEMLEKKSIGAVQVPCVNGNAEEIKRINAHAGYPVLICSDMETGFPMSKYKIPSMMALASLNDEEIAYQHGCVTAIEAKKLGYNTVWAPNVDMVMGNARSRVIRTCGSDENYVAKITTAVLKGYLDNGMFATAKHFPGGRDITVDTHMEEGLSMLTEKDILDVDMVPYANAMKEANLPGIMTKHVVYPKIDPVYPASMSKKLLSILRNQGFDGLILTDSFAMMGILQKHSEDKCYGIAIAAGIDMVLPNYRVPFKTSYEYLLNSYKSGAFTEERLNEAVARVIRAQNSTMKPATATEISEYQKQCIERVWREGICLIKDENVSAKLEAGKKRLFVVLAENLYDDSNYEVREWTEKTGGSWAAANKIIDEIKEKFPDANCVAINVFPNKKQIENVCFESTKVDEVHFITFAEVGAYAGSENLTEKITNLMAAMKSKLSTIVHFGNPYSIAKAPHFPRVIYSLGPVDMKYPLEVLTGKLEPKGKLPIDIQLN